MVKNALEAVCRQRILEVRRSERLKPGSRTLAATAV
jgi:hypothetical protein